MSGCRDVGMSGCRGAGRTLKFVQQAQFIVDVAKHGGRRRA